MTTKVFRGLIDEHAPFNAYLGFPPAPPRPIAIKDGYNVDSWEVDSQGVIFNYKIIHNLNLAHPGKLIVQLKYVYSFGTSDPVGARLYPGDKNHFIVQTFGLRGGVTGPNTEYEHSCGFIFEAELFS